jgi:hypothetical protein
MHFTSQGGQIAKFTALLATGNYHGVVGFAKARGPTAKIAIQRVWIFLIQLTFQCHVYNLFGRAFSCSRCDFMIAFSFSAQRIVADVLSISLLACSPFLLGCLCSDCGANLCALHMPFFSFQNLFHLYPC